MQFGQWEFTMPYENRNVSVTAEQAGLSVQFRDEKYTVLKCVLDEAGDKGYALAEVDLNEPVWCPWMACSSSAEVNPTYLMERRPELYGDLCIPVEY